MILDNENSIYLGNLNYEVTEEDVKFLFSRYGSIKNLKLMAPKGIAFVTLDNEEDAELAIKALDGVRFLNRELRIGWYQ